jgi:hypothetical protein
MKEFLVWLDTPKCRRKRQMERQPYAETYQKDTKKCLRRINLPNIEQRKKNKQENENV